MSNSSWAIDDWQIEPGCIRARLSTSSKAEAQWSTVQVKPPEAPAVQLMLEQLSLSALKIDALLRTAPEMDEPKRSLSGTQTISVLNIASFIEEQEQLTVAELLSSCTPYLNSEDGSLYDYIEGELQNEPQIGYLIQESLSKLAEHPLLAWKLAGWEQEQLLAQIWKCWRDQMPAAADIGIDGETAEEDHAALSDEPSLGSLLAESAAAGTLHQVGEGLADVQSYLQTAEQTWHQSGHEIRIFQPSGDDDIELPDIPEILPEVKTAMDGYEEIRRKVADRIRQRYLAEQRKK